MDGSDIVFPPAGFLTGGNAQEIGPNQPIRDASAARRINGPRGDPQPSTLPIADSGTSDPVSLGFEKIMARFDKLEFRMEATDRRVDDLEVPLIPDPDPPYFSDDAEGWPHRSHREVMATDGDVPRYFNHSLCARGGDVRRRRIGGRDHPRREGRLADQHQITQRGRPYVRQRSAWDRPSGRFPQALDRGFNGYRQPTSWDSPVIRPSHSGDRFGHEVKDYTLTRSIKNTRKFE